MIIMLKRLINRLKRQLKILSEQNLSEIMSEYLKLFIAVTGVSGTVIFIFIIIVFLAD